MPTLKIEPGDAEGHFMLSENIDEYMDFKLLDESSSSHLKLDLNQIRRINSIGIKLWSEKLTELQEKGKTITFTQCSEVVTQSCNIWPPFAKGVTMESLEVTFQCESCEEYVTKMVDGKVSSNSNRPLIPCPQCGELMDFEDEGALDFLEELKLYL